MKSELLNAFPAHAAVIANLPERDLKTLYAVVDTETDDLIHLDSEGFSVNHGSVGSLGIRYDFNKS